MITRSERYIKTYRISPYEVIEASIEGIVRRKYRHDDVNPSIITSDGTEIWYWNDLVHRSNGPAVIRADGTREYYRNGQLHREDGPAIEYPDGDIEYFLAGLRHRVGGPALIHKDSEKYYQRGCLHREDGPASITYLSKDASYSWYFKGRFVFISTKNTEEELDLFRDLTNLEKVEEVMNW